MGKMTRDDRPVSEASAVLRATITAHRDEIGTVLRRYSAVNPRLFGSVARGDATPGSAIDLLVDLIPGAGNPLLRISGLSEELGRLLGVHVDVITPTLMREPLHATVYEGALAV